MALQQDPRKRAPRYTETYSKRNYQPSKKPLMLITTGIVACTVAVAAVAVSCQGGLDMGGTSNPGSTIEDPSSKGGDPSTSTDTKDKKDDTSTSKDKQGNGSSSANGNNGSSGSSSASSNKYTPGEKVNVPASTTTTGSSAGSAFNQPAVTVSFSPKREKSSLETYCDRLSDRISKLSKFCDNVFNEHLGSSYSTIAADYDEFEKVRKKVLKGIVDEDGDWCIYTFYGDKYLDAKVDMAKASKLLVKRLDMIDDAYQAMLSLGKGASSDEYVTAANAKLKDYASVTKKMSKLVKSAKATMGI